MTATAPRPVCRLLPSVGLPTVDGATVVVTACCDQEITHAIDQSPPGDGGEDPMDLTAWFDGDGSQVGRCKCGLPLPDARRWRP